MLTAGDSQTTLRDYVAELQRNLASGIALENTHRPALHAFLESLDPTINAFNDPKHIDVGAPDFTIRRKAHEIDFPVGWLETKDIGEDLDKIEKTDQMARYLGLPNLILTDYLEFRWYTDGKLRLTSRLATLTARKKLLHDVKARKRPPSFSPNSSTPLHRLVRLVFGGARLLS